MPPPPEMAEARERVFAACRANGVAFLELASPADLARKLDAGVRAIAGASAAMAREGRSRQRRRLPA